MFRNDPAAGVAWVDSAGELLADGWLPTSL
jgi:hypothetical protein